jgi:hypothetical protein
MSFHRIRSMFRSVSGWPAVLLEQREERALRQELDVLCEHAEQATGEEGCDVLGLVAGRFEGARDRGEVASDFASDGGRGARRVEFRRLEPDPPQALAHVRARQVGELDPVGAGVGERRVGAAGARELGVELDHVPDVDDHQEGRAALGGREGPGVVLGLSAGAQQRVVEALGLRPLTDLLGLEDERAAPVAVDEARAGAAVAVGEGHPALEDVGVVARVLARRIGGGHVEECAELPDEELVVRALRA